MSIFDVLEENYKAPDRVVVDIPLPSSDSNVAQLFFRGIQSVPARKTLEEKARKWAGTNLVKNQAKALGIDGSEAEEWLKKAGLLADTSIGSSEDETKPLTHAEAMRLLLMPELFQLVWSQWETGQRTINNALIEIYIKEAKKKSQDSEDSLPLESGTPEAQQD
jgi:hypothetical protein